MQRRDLLKLSAMFLGGTVSASLSQALLADVSANPKAFVRVFDAGQQQSVKLLSDMIIPNTDTPGAVEAGVHDFIATIVDEWYTETERSIFMEGLAALDTYCQEHSQQHFHLTDESGRVAALQYMEKLASQYKSPQAATQMARPAIDETEPFFTKLKGLVVLGYYTSEVGSTQELAYRPVPGTYNGDYDFAQVGRQWSH